MTVVPTLLSADEELPMTGTAPVGWCENYAFVAHDESAGLHLIFCTGCQPYDLSLWHEFLLLGLPGGKTFAWRSAGRGGDDRGPGGALSTWRCLEPGDHWQFAFSGYGRVVDTELLAAAALTDGPWTRSELELEFRSAGPPWRLGGHTLQNAGETSPFHYEQVGRVTGTATIGERTLELDGTGHRDHSRGPRDYGSVLDHAWIDGQFPSGRHFALYRMRLADGSEGVAAACVGDADDLRNARVISVPLLAEDAASAQRFQIVLETDDGRETIDAEVVRPFGTTSYMTPNGTAAGCVDADEVTQIVSDAATRFTWRGEQGSGHTQRSRAPLARTLREASA